MSRVRTVCPLGWDGVNNTDSTVLKCIHVQSLYTVSVYLTTIGDNKNDYIPVKRVYGKHVENRTK